MMRVAEGVTDKRQPRISMPNLQHQFTIILKLTACYCKPLNLYAIGVTVCIFYVFSHNPRLKSWANNQKPFICNRFNGFAITQKSSGQFGLYKNINL
jgi:hypothetical protein